MDIWGNSLFEFKLSDSPYRSLLDAFVMGMKGNLGGRRGGETRRDRERRVSEAGL